MDTKSSTLEQRVKTTSDEIVYCCSITASSGNYVYRNMQCAPVGLYDTRKMSKS